MLLGVELVLAPESKRLGGLTAPGSIGEPTADEELKNVEESRRSRRWEEVGGGREKDVLVVSVRDAGSAMPGR